MFVVVTSWICLCCPCNRVFLIVALREQIKNKNYHLNRDIKWVSPYYLHCVVGCSVLVHMNAILKCTFAHFRLNLPF